MITAQQFERIEKLVQPISAIGAWLLPKVLTLLLTGMLALAGLVFYALQFWHWHYLWLLPIGIFSLPVIILGIWALLLWDLAELPEALAGLKTGFFGAKDDTTKGKPVTEKPVVERPTMSLGKTRKLPSLLKELWGLVQGVDALRTIVTHVIFLANPISWLLFVVSALAVSGYALLMIVTSLVYWL